MTAANPTISTPGRAQFAEWLRAATPAFLFGLRMWASVCLAFYVSFQLELNEPSWSATTAAIICQPVLGASLRKAPFRLIGSVIGAIGIVILAGLFRQSREGFLVGLALWCAVSAFIATLLRNFAAYAAALAGYTAAILASDVLGPVGATNSGDVTIMAIDRAPRDWHRHRERRRCARLDRSRPLATKACGGVRCAVDRDHGWLRRLFFVRQHQS